MGQKEVYIVGTARTPFGSFQGSLASVSAPRLGATAIKAALERAGVGAGGVSEVVLGNVLSAGVGQAPARQAAIFAGVPTSVPAMTVNKVCGSGMKSILLGTGSILLGEGEIVVAGGMESMSRAPYLSPGARAGLRMGHHEFLDSMVHDGLWDPYNEQHMGNCAELCAEERGFSREQQDAYAIRSFRRAQEAQSEGKFDVEIAAVEVPGRKGDTVTVDRDEGPGKVRFDKVSELRPAFRPKGTVTAANSSTINDGAAVVVLASGKAVRDRALVPLARIVSWGGNAQDPEWFTTAPAEAMRRAMARAGWQTGDVDIFEVNEAFAVVALAAQDDIDIPDEKLNVWGGAISLGHPIGASGARIVVTLISILHDRGLSRGVAGICIGGGEATAICVEIS